MSAPLLLTLLRHCSHAASSCQSCGNVRHQCEFYIRTWHCSDEDWRAAGWHDRFLWLWLDLQVGPCLPGHCGHTGWQCGGSDQQACPLWKRKQDKLKKKISMSSTLYTTGFSSMSNCNHDRFFPPFYWLIWKLILWFNYHSSIKKYESSESIYWNIVM